MKIEKTGPGAGRPTPSVSVGTLAKLMGGATPAQQMSLLRRHKYPSDGPKRSYQNATKQLVNFLVDATDLDPLAPNLRVHERDALTFAVTYPPTLPPDVSAVRPGRGDRWQITGVEISMFPDVETVGPLGRGAAKFVLTKDLLPPRVGSTMAALLWYHRSEVLRLDTSEAYCRVFEPRAGTREGYAPGTNPMRQIRTVTTACEIIAAIWPSIRAA